MANPASSADDEGEVSMGIIREAMAFRVKYRIGDGRSLKRLVHLEMLCVHKGNRGGVYPTPVTVANLGIGVFQDGFNPEEANHEGVCVQEVPDAERPHDRETSHAWNKKKIAGTMLANCFPAENGVATFCTLSHSHLLLTLLSWLYGVKWDIPHGPFASKWKRVLNEGGHLKSDAVASVEPELAATLTRGLCMEILSWKIELEEPNAPRMIAQALNKGQSRALETTELTAMAVLTGEAMAQMKGLANEVQYEAVKEKLRAELDLFVDDPDFIELYDFVINLGCNLNTFVPGLLEWASKFVDSKQRRLRLSVFIEANKIFVWAPRTKVAVIQRAYRQHPTKGMCPNPEALWGKAMGVDVETLEQLLCYFQSDCKSIVDKMGTVQSLAFQGNVAIAATDVYAGNKGKKNFKACLLQTTKRYYDQLGELIKTNGRVASLPAPPQSWIDYSTVVEKELKDKEKESPAKACLPRIIVHSEASVQTYRGNVKDDQALYERGEKTAETQWNPLPWKEWLRSALAQDLDAEKADKAAIISVLRGLHTHGSFQSMPLDVLQKGSEKVLRAKVTKDIDVAELSLPPCVPKSAPMLEESSHAQRIAIVVTRQAHGTPDAVKTYYVVPEYKPPVDDTDDTEAAVAAAADTEAAVAANAKAWQFKGDETMHPFWAIPRVSATEVQKAKAKAKEPIEINMGLTTKRFQSLVVGNWCEARTTNVIAVDVPFLTNLVPLKKGALLYCESAAKQVSQKRSLNWKDAVQDNARASKKAQAKPPAPARVGKGELMSAEEI